MSTIVWPPNQFLKIDFAHNIIYNWIYPTSGPDRAHRHRQNCIYLRLFVLQIIFQKLTLHKTSSIIGYIPPLGPSGPTDKSRTVYIHNCLTVSTDSLVGDNCKILQFFQSTDSFLWQLSMVHWQLSDLTAVRSDSCTIWQLITDSCPLTKMYVQWGLGLLAVVHSRLCALCTFHNAQYGSYIM